MMKQRDRKKYRETDRERETDSQEPRQLKRQPEDKQTYNGIQLIYLCVCSLNYATVVVDVDLGPPHTHKHTHLEGKRDCHSKKRSMRKNKKIFRQKSYLQMNLLEC